MSLLCSRGFRLKAERDSQMRGILISQNEKSARWGADWSVRFLEAGLAGFARQP
jgi:hypothetical protein